MVPRDYVWGFMSDGLQFIFYKFVKNDVNGVLFTEFVLSPKRTFDLFVKIAHCFQFGFEMKIKINGELKDLTEIEYLSTFEKIYKNEISKVYELGPYIIKMNGKIKLMKVFL